MLHAFEDLQLLGVRAALLCIRGVRLLERGLERRRGGDAGGNAEPEKELYCTRAHPLLQRVTRHHSAYRPGREARRPAPGHARYHLHL
jgi:hypothetical protein